MCVAICKLFSLVFVCLVGVNLGRKRQQHWRSFPVLLTLDFFMGCMLVRKEGRQGRTHFVFFFSFGLWQENHPPILGMFEKLMKAAKGKQVAVFLDYDGTLSPIVEDPDKAYMSPDVRLQSLAICINSFSVVL